MTGKCSPHRTHRTSVATLVGFLLVVLALTAACGGDDDDNGAEDISAAAAELTPLEAEVYEELAEPPLGLTDAERRCEAVALSEGVDSAQEALDRTAPYTTPGEALLDLAPHCVSAR